MFHDHSYESKLRQLAEQIGLDGSVTFTGIQNNVRELMNQLDVFVHASTNGEPFGRVVGEPMAAGKPVVVTNGGAIPKIVDHQDSGLVLPMCDPAAMANAIGWLIGNPQRAKPMGEKGRERFHECFTTQSAVRRVEEIYEIVLQTHRLRC